MIKHLQVKRHFLQKFSKYLLIGLSSLVLIYFFSSPQVRILADDDDHDHCSGIIRSRNIFTGECRNFEDVCLPFGWVIDNNCTLTNPAPGTGACPTDFTVRRCQPGTSNECAFTTTYNSAQNCAASVNVHDCSFSTSCASVSQPPNTGSCDPNPFRCSNGALVFRNPNNNCNFDLCPQNPGGSQCSVFTTTDTTCSGQQTCTSTVVHNAQFCGSSQSTFNGCQFINGQCSFNSGGNVCGGDVISCPDGSTVGRNPNNSCQFFACPNSGTTCRTITCSAPLGCSYQNSRTSSCNPSDILTCGQLVCNNPEPTAEPAPVVTQPAPAPAENVTQINDQTQHNTQTNNQSFTLRIED